MRPSNLLGSAYEISNFHKREPPPKEILEDVSAKGGDLLTRTVENYLRPTSRETDRLRNGEDDSDESDEDGEKKTPREDKMDVDDPATLSRSTRCMCQTLYTMSDADFHSSTSSSPAAARSVSTRDLETRNSTIDRPYELPTTQWRVQYRCSCDYSEL